MTSTALASLPFVVVRRGKPTILWSVSPSGDWATDNETGVEYADRIVDYMAAEENPTLLALVAKEAAMDKSGIRVGFFQRLAEMAINGR